MANRDTADGSISVPTPKHVIAKKLSMFRKNQIRFAVVLQGKLNKAIAPMDRHDKSPPPSGASLLKERSVIDPHFLERSLTKRFVSAR